jgi:hypothetical protein
MAKPPATADPSSRANDLLPNSLCDPILVHSNFRASWLQIYPGSLSKLGMPPGIV